MTKHGQANSGEYSSWQNAKRRCHDESHPRYADWGGKGVVMCTAWRNDFSRFLSDVGPRPGPGYSIDRIDGAKGYEPGNCRWATAKQQSINRPTFVRLISFNGDTKTLTDWARSIGISREALRDRIKTGWSIEAALTTPKGASR